MRESNWAGNLTYSATHVERPRSVEQLQAIMAAAQRVHVLGSRHSFNAVADAPELISLDELPGQVTIDSTHRTVSCPASTRYGDLAQHLDVHGLALHNMASLPHISIAGAIATATHGSGVRNGNLATAVTELELVTSDGELRSFSRGDLYFPGLVVGLGTLGAVTRVGLQVEPSYELRQRVYEGLGFRTLVERFDEIMQVGYSVSVFTGWGAGDGQIWVKTRVDRGSDAQELEMFGAVAARQERHPVAREDPVKCTPQLGRPGPWWDRLPHFRMQYKPSVGQELQSEYLIPRRHAVAALEAVQSMADTIRPALQISEIRTIAVDDLWLSPQYAEDTLAIHFTWVPDESRVQRVLPDLEQRLEAFEARPHWGKLFAMSAPDIAHLYPRVSDFRQLRDSMDPRGALRNAWFERHFGT